MVDAAGEVGQSCVVAVFYPYPAIACDDNAAVRLDLLQVKRWTSTTPAGARRSASTDLATWDSITILAEVNRQAGISNYGTGDGD